VLPGPDEKCRHHHSQHRRSVLSAPLQDVGRHQNDSGEWRNPELPLEDGKILVLDAEPLPAEEFPIFAIG